jgi:hypothetical protein
MRVRIINNHIAEVNNLQSPGEVVELPDELVGTHLSRWLYVEGEFIVDSDWENPDLNPNPPVFVY